MIKNTVLRRLSLFDGRIKLRHKLLIAFILIVLVPTLSIGFFSYQKSSSIIQEQTSHAYLEALRQTSINIAYRLREVENISELIYTNEKLQKIVRKAASQELSISEVYEDYKSLTEIITNLEKNRNIFRIRLFVPGNPLYATENRNIFTSTKEDAQKLNDELLGQPGLMKWSYVGQQAYLSSGYKSVISLHRLMKDFDQVNNVLGAVAIDMDENTLNEVLRDMSLSLPYQAMLVNKDSLITAYTNKQDTPAIGWEELKQKLQSQPMVSQGYQKIGIQGKPYLYLVYPVEQLDWKLVVLIPTMNITDQSTLLGIFIFGLTLLLIAVAIALSILLSGKITHRIHILAEKMKGIEQGNFGEMVEVSGNDEISLLQRRFNRMSAEINNLIEEVYKITISKQQEEMKVLEGRINSHFLYNTLDTVKWMAFRNNEPDIVQIVTSLSKFFRISLNKGNDILTVEKELEHVGAYMDIQNVRFDGLLGFHTDIDAELSSMQIIKLIVQPVVENAIIHGINKKPDKQGNISIKGTIIGDFIEFTVIDDGVGMDRDTVATLFEETGTGYGLRNVHQRLVLSYGQDCGVAVWSKPGMGTAVKLTLRKERRVFLV
ncbi:cache domain-containing sensor histidine kinase [Paenibacillus agricola]|uniref:histidine kinase n=1 Tax=Paenibacillus agricola TaxID=2716264 RepID=A0ABX0J8H8_9BACL|nr:sensor histidine kinase [Paenibacillus agricola]NHN31908.1 sensor histidine kinase [Paenibacillus agricola]